MTSFEVKRIETSVKFDGNRQSRRKMGKAPKKTS